MRQLPCVAGIINPSQHPFSSSDFNGTLTWVLLHTALWATTTYPPELPLRHWLLFPHLSPSSSQGGETMLETWARWRSSSACEAAKLVCVKVWNQEKGFIYASAWARTGCWEARVYGGENKRWQGSAQEGLYMLSSGVRVCLKGSGESLITLELCQGQICVKEEWLRGRAGVRAMVLQERWGHEVRQREGAGEKRRRPDQTGRLSGVWGGGFRRV